MSQNTHERYQRNSGIPIRGHVRDIDLIDREDTFHLI